MARPLRIQYPGAIYHVMTRGNGGQRVFRDDRDYQRMTDGLEKTVWAPDGKCSRLCGCPITSTCSFARLRRIFRWACSICSAATPTGTPPTSRVPGRRRSGHLFQGRFKGELVEDEIYFWNVSRYLHLNPAPGKRPLVEHPKDWPHSSYRGYARRKDRAD